MSDATPPKRAIPISRGTPLQAYFSRKASSTISTRDLPLEEGAVGRFSPWGVLYILVFATVPIAYIYMLLILIRELCVRFPETLYEPLQHYLPFLANIVSTMEKSSLFVEVWCVIEGVFFVIQKLHIRWLQLKDPLEASLSSAPMMELEDRRILWDRMMEAEHRDPVNFITGWFFDEPLENITRYDIRDFCTWSMFEGRNQEHLTGEEVEQMESFIEELEWRLSVHMHGLAEADELEHDSGEGPALKRHERLFSNELRDHPLSKSDLNMVEKLCHAKKRPQPKEAFRFPEGNTDHGSSLFTNLFENYKSRYEQYKNRMDASDFHPMQDFRNFVAEAEENAMTKASSMYEALVAPGSNIDKQLSALGHATQMQLSEAWNSVKGMKERLETAKFLSNQRKKIRQQLKGYQMLLKRMRSMSSSVPSKQMARLMRKITECNEGMERIERSAMESFGKATGYARKNLPLFSRKEPQRYAKYSSDPLLGLATYPLGFHLLVLAATEIPLRIMMKNRGFTRQTVGPVAYYYHPGIKSYEEEVDDDEEREMIPIVFVHGIGVGLITYIPLIDHLLKSGRPILLPEIPYVSGFRPWQSPNAVLPPTVVSSTMTDMLATNGYLRGTFVGHSYGTSWLSYMIKYAPNAIAAVVFLDPICFCLHIPRLTKQFVYVRADPGSISYMVRTDVIVNWTIQRSFPWTWIALFTEQIHVPCSIFLSDLDMLVPAAKIEGYLKSKGAAIMDFADVDRRHFVQDTMNVTVFRGHVHGGWTDEPSSTSPVIAECVNILSVRAEEIGTGNQ